MHRPPHLRHPTSARFNPHHHFPSSSGRPPTSETLDSTGSALSTKCRKPLATSNHYFRERERTVRGGGGWSDAEREEKNKWKTQKQREISDFSCAQSLHYSNVQGPISLIHNGMIPIIHNGGTNKNHWMQQHIHWRKALHYTHAELKIKLQRNICIVIKYKTA